MTDPRFPHRPDHHDFWLLSQGLIEQDAQADSGQPFEDLTARYVDVRSLLYVAEQRAALALKDDTRTTYVYAANDVRAKMIGMWVDAFVQGARFQALKAAEGSAALDDAAALEGLS